MAQIAVIGSASALLTERVVRRMLPLASLLNMTLVFPDRAPSRFGVALRSGTFNQLRRSASQGNTCGQQEAAEQLVVMVTALGRHDRLTRGHTERVRAYADLIGEELDLSNDDRERLQWGAMVHDVGKIIVAPEILNSTGRPSDAQWAILKQHPAAGGELVEPLAGWLGEWRLAAGQHHERWDGNGYPNGLAGTDISLAGRIVAVADAYDVISSKRSYKNPMSAEAARQEMVDCAGTQFDPEVVRALLSASLDRKRSRLGFLGWFTELGGLSALPRGIGQAVALTTTAAAIAAGAITATPFDAGNGNADERAAEAPTVFDSAPNSLPHTGDISTMPAASIAPSPVPTSEPSQTSQSKDQPQQENAQTNTSPTTTGRPTSSSPLTSSNATTTTGQPTTIPITNSTTTTSAPATTTTTTTLPPTTTTVAPPTNIDWDLGGDGFTTSQAVLPLDGTPSAGALQNYDTDRDGDPGLYIQKGDGLNETDQNKMQRWAKAAGGVHLNGTPNLTLWAATKDFDTGKTGRLAAGIYNCNASHGGCSLLASATTTFNQATNGTDFGQLDLTMNPIDVTLAANRTLVVKIGVTNSSDDDLWLAYSTTTYPANLTIS